MLNFAILPLIASVTGTFSDPPPQAAVPADDRMAQAAVTFLDTLRPAARRAAQLPLDSDARTEWNFVPLARRGLPIADMAAEERIAAQALFRAGLSAEGYLKTGSIIELETVLRQMAESRGRRADFRDPERYYVTIFGDPSPNQPWAWRLEGHHLSLNFSFGPDRAVAATPAFFGANPAEVREGRRAGWRVLADEEDLARQLVDSLDDAQRKAAVIQPTAPPDILLGPGTEANALADAVGLPISAMKPHQSVIANALINVYLAPLEDDIARAHRARIDDAGIDNVHFAWAGPTQPGKGHYYRLQGPTFVIEYDNTQDGANHIHTVYRDLERDFGGDALREHIRLHHSAP